MLRHVARHLLPGSLHGQYVTLEVISGKNLKIPSGRIPAGIYVFVNLDSRRRWTSLAPVLFSDSSVAWGDTVTVSSHGSPQLSLEIRASFELGRMLGNGELIGKLETSWDELLRHGNEPFVETTDEVYFIIGKGIARSPSNSFTSASFKRHFE
ncbi:hypothetical protein DFH29DRAFT_1002692 [Suillus ampliporus]|nr:hypothetical protein DFH29DRAFT_1002692 [Suillus ampliporus]